MFPDQFLPNAAIAAVGFATAFYWLRSGMVPRGIALLVVLAVSADIALVARFVYSERGAWFHTGLWTLQSVALVTGSWLLLALVRRRWSADARRREELFAAGFQHYLRDEFASARDLFARILRADPWDVPAAVALANVSWRQGRPRRARTLLRRARQIDRAGIYRDFIGEQLRRIAVAGAASPTAAQPGPVATVAASN